MTHVLTKEQFQLFQRQFKEIAHAKALTPAHMLLYALVKGKSWDYCFTPIKNETRLRCQSNGDPLINIYSFWWQVERSVKTHFAQKYQTGIIKQFPGVFDLVALNSLQLTLKDFPKPTKEQ